MKKLLLLILLIFVTSAAYPQQYQQYFDGADTIYNPWQSPSSLLIVIDTDSTNIWQIGSPQKPIFDSAATNPNVLVTDTINLYPVNNTSSFQFTYVPFMQWSIIAIQWKQKLDMDHSLDGGKVEFSNDAGVTWQNAFNNQYVYNFYGYQPANMDTLPNTDFVFTGTDSVWRDIWLCFDLSWLSFNDSIIMRYTFMSDSIDNNREGWMIDNMLVHITIAHTVGELPQEKYLNVYPNPTSDIIYIETQKLQEFHIIEHMELVNAKGQVVEEWHNIPTKFFISTKKYSSGQYILKVRTNKKSESVPIMIQHN